MKLKLLFFICFFTIFLNIDILYSATVYQHSNYKGRSQKLDQGKYNCADLKKKGAIGDDCISSLKVSDGYKITLFHDPNYKKKPKSFLKDTTYVGNDINDKTSSIIVEKLYNSNIPAAIYSGNGYTGIQQALSVGKYDKTKLDKLIGSMDIKSCKVSKNYRVVLYEDLNKSTGRQVISNNISNIPTSLRGKITYISVEPYNSGSCVTLYSEKDFKGVQQSFGIGGFSDLNQVIGNGKVKSLKVENGYRVVLYDGLNGIRKSFIGNVNDIGSELIGKTRYVSVEKADGGNPYITVFNDKNYKGLQQSFSLGKINYKENRKYPSVSDLCASKIMYKNIKSLRIEKGFKAKLYSNDYCLGTPDAIVSGDISDARSKMKKGKAICSIKLERDLKNEIVTVAEKAEFDGTIKELKEGEYPSDKIGLPNKNISSIFVPKGYVVILHSGNNFSGNSIAFNAASSDIQIDNLKNIFDSKTCSIIVTAVDSSN